jgi:trk system potassium uptake protein
MNLRLLSKALGAILLLLSFAMLPCLAYSYAAQGAWGGTEAVDAFWISLVATAFAGGVLLLLGRNSGREILRKETIAIVGLGWLLSGIFGALPYLFSEPRLSLSQALFESMSGFTTTGATVIQDLNEFPRSILLWRALTQWLGGLGILVLFVALLTYLGVGSKALFRHESSAKTGEGLKARIHDVAARLWQIYLVLTVVCFGGLMLLGLNFYDALTHTFTTVATGGFSSRNESIAAFDSVAVECWIILFMVLGAISFMLYAWLLRKSWERWEREEEAKFFLGILAVATLVLALDLIFMKQAASLPEAFRAAGFQAASILTTTGYVTRDFDQWPPFSRVVLLLLMFVGGCAGSTSGSIKVSRWILFFRIMRVEVLRVFRPNQVFGLHLNGNPVDEGLQMQTVFFVALAGASVAVGTLVVSLFEPALDIMSSFSAVVACLFNIGPGLGAVGPMQNFAHFSAPMHVFLSLLMVLGRLEFFAILVLFAPSLWRKY